MSPHGTAKRRTTMNIRVLVLAALLSGLAVAVDPLPFRPPAVPLVPVTCSPVAALARTVSPPNCGDI